MPESLATNRNRIGSFCFAAFASLVLAIAIPQVELSSAEETTAIDFSRDIRPLLAQHCFSCHGFDAASRQAGLRLDLAAGAFAKLESGAVAVVPGKPDQSELIARVSSKDSQLRMPPASTGHQLSAAEIAKLKRWIESGAKYDDHWSFRPIARPLLPQSSNATWVRGAIDTFVLARLDQEKLSPSPEADRETLVRRLSLDLLGLPPNSEDVEAFVADTSPDAYQRLVDRLLASPHFGERWGRHWLDIAHYADSDGYLGDGFRNYAWLYRDWVINAVNRDLPFDQFTIQQLAGDLLPDAGIAERTATGFLRNTMRNTEAGVDLEEYRLKEIVDRVNTMGIGWLGLSLGCAECHAHKFDPVSHREFYQLFAFFNDADDVDVSAPLPGERERYESRQEAWTKEDLKLAPAVDAAFATNGEVLRKALAAEPKKRTADQTSLLESLKKSAGEDARKLLEAYEAHLAKKPSAPATKVMALAKRKESRQSYIHLRGDYRSRGENVSPGTPEFLPRFQPSSKQPDRLDLAKWLVDSSQPLTPRVTVNHFWKVLFGRGIVASVDNFGAGGDVPSHPEMLDWLARELIDKQWSRKEMVRLIVDSATYRQSSTSRRELELRDPMNVLLARQSRFRFEAEVVRDAALAASGLLERKFGGPGIRPPQPDYVASISRNVDWKVSEPPELYRRGMYIVFRRATPYPMLLTFDAPDSSVICTRRERSNSPLQALTLLNDPVFFECAQVLGKELASEPSQTFEEKIAGAFRRCLGRAPREAEVIRLRSFFEQRRAEFAADPGSAKSVINAKAAEKKSDKRKPLPESSATEIAAVEQAAWIVTARILMNLDEFITRE